MEEEGEEEEEEEEGEEGGGGGGMTYETEFEVRKFIQRWLSPSLSLSLTLSPSLSHSLTHSPSLSLSLPLSLSLSLVRFSNNKIVRAYCLILSNYRNNSSTLNHAVVKMLYRIAVDMKMTPLLYQISIFRIFLSILQEPPSPRVHVSHVHT